MQADAQAGNPQVRGELEVRVPITDHEAAWLVDFVRGQKILHQSYLRLAAGTSLVFEVRANENCLELDALRLELLHDEGVRLLERLARQAGRAQSVLIADHDEAEPGTLQIQ